MCNHMNGILLLWKHDYIILKHSEQNLLNGAASKMQQKKAEGTACLNAFVSLFIHTLYACVQLCWSLVMQMQVCKGCGRFDP